MKKLLYIVSEDWYFCSHRLGLAIAAKQAGWQVAVATNCSVHKEQIISNGIDVFPLNFFHRTKINLFINLLCLKELFNICKLYKPDLVHNVAMKPVLFGTISAWFASVPQIINAFGGLGFLFIEMSHKKTVKKKIIRYLLRPFFRLVLDNLGSCLILQNKDDIDKLVNEKYIKSVNIRLIRGCGVDINHYIFQKSPVTEVISVALFARMLWDKGIGEFVEVAKIFKSKGIKAKFIIYGRLDNKNPAGIPRDIILNWQQQKLIEWGGHLEDIVNSYARIHIAVLPSYREGLPKALLEAASCGRPVVAFDVPGCREVVRHNENGLLVKYKDVDALASAIELLVSSKTMREKMGVAGRKIIEQHFADHIIQKQTLELYERI